MKDNLKKLPYKKWQKEVSSLLQSSFLEEAYLDSGRQLLMGVFEGAQSSAVFLEFKDAKYRFYCSSCEGRFCSHAAALVEFYLEDAGSFFEGDLPVNSLKVLHHQSWQFFESKKRKKNVSALRKKLVKMSEGLEFAEEILQQVFEALPQVDTVEQLLALREQVERLDEYFLPGLTVRFKKLISASSCGVSQCSSLFDALQECKKILQVQLSTETLEYGDSLAYAFMGHIWKVDELRLLNPPEKGRFLQLSFECVENTYAERLEDTAVWLNLENGKIQLTQNLRPFKSLRYLKQEDSEDSIVECREYFRYPGSMNSRIRWQSSSKRMETKDDYSGALNWAEEDFKALLKSVKECLLQPMNTVFPKALVKFEYFVSSQDSFYIKFSSDVMLPIQKDHLKTSELMLKQLSSKQLKNAALLIEFSLGSNLQEISVRPLCLLNENEKIRLA